ncbi:hypothetical protein B0H19DRAFT_1073162 [Mycena capillaripes]|nr:hypothetical protein B0H19DRAFT_1073162 [Mycena capillaripes]
MFIQNQFASPSTQKVPKPNGNLWIQPVTPLPDLFSDEYFPALGSKQATRSSSSNPSPVNRGRGVDSEGSGYNNNSMVEEIMAPASPRRNRAACARIEATAQAKEALKLERQRQTVETVGTVVEFEYGVGSEVANENDEETDEAVEAEASRQSFPATRVFQRTETPADRAALEKRNAQHLEREREKETGRRGEREG